MTRPRRAWAVAAIGGTVTLITGLLPVMFLEWARRAGSLGKLSSLGLWVMAVLVVVIAGMGWVVVYRAAMAGTTRSPDLWVALFLALVTWSVGVLTLVPGLVFLRLTDDRSLDQYGARFFLEWTLVYAVVAAAAYALGRWSLRSLVQETQSIAASSQD